MPADFLPARDRELYVWAVNFLQVAQSHTDSLGLSAADFALLNAQFPFFGDDLQTVTALKAQYKSVVKSKDTRRGTVTTDIRSLVKRIQAHPGVTPDLKASLGINAGNGTRRRILPVTPAQVVAEPFATGINALKWDGMGNIPRTQYVVQAKSFAAGAELRVNAGWKIVGVTTSHKFAHKNVVVGEAMAYRIVAARGSQESLPSLPVTVYAGQGGN